MTLAIAEAWADEYKPPSERAITMARLYAEEGLTLEEIGQRYGVSRQRVDQIIKPFGLQGHYGRRKQNERAQRLAEAHARIMAGESTSAEEAAALGYKSATYLRGALYELGLPLRVPLPPAKHGEMRKYRQGCRCDKCRRANREELYAWRERRGVREHGTASAYQNFGCRCAACKEAARIQRRAVKARRRQEQEAVT